MRKIREILRLKYELKLSDRAIGESCQTSRTSVGRCLEKVRQANLSWPLPAELDDEQLEQLLYPSEMKLNYTPPDWTLIHQEMKKKGVVLLVLWDEYRATEPNGIGYSRFCDLYRQFKKTLDPVMRQTHKAGEKLFVDYAGMTMLVFLANKSFNEVSSDFLPTNVETPIFSTFFIIKTSQFQRSLLQIIILFKNDHCRFQRKLYGAKTPKIGFLRLYLC